MQSMPALRAGVPLVGGPGSLYRRARRRRPLARPNPASRPDRADRIDELLYTVVRIFSTRVIFPRSVEKATAHGCAVVPGAHADGRGVFKPASGRQKITNEARARMMAP